MQSFVTAEIHLRNISIISSFISSRPISLPLTLRRRLRNPSWGWNEMMSLWNSILSINLMHFRGMRSVCNRWSCVERGEIFPAQVSHASTLNWIEMMFVLTSLQYQFHSNITNFCCHVVCALRLLSFAFAAVWINFADETIFGVAITARATQSLDVMKLQCTLHMWVFIIFFLFSECNRISWVQWVSGECVFRHSECECSSHPTANIFI